MDYVEISPEQMSKLPSDFTLYACPKCGCSLFALDHNTVEEWSKLTDACCLGCGNVIRLSGSEEKLPRAIIVEQPTEEPV